MTDVDVPVLVVAERGVVERHAAAQQILLEAGRSRHMRELLHLAAYAGTAP
ncbi:hypothetical protein [Streptomyces atroolivaceus]|uniref:hypothetical protein n=1 Tax=Streptomyces atroolivaceus TaxID=66869 RepID=UPI0036368287